MKMSSLRDLTKEELLQKKNDMIDELFKLQMRKSLKELENPLRLRTIRRDIARIETILTEDNRGIKKIVDAPVSILGAADKKEPEKKESTD